MLWVIVVIVSLAGCGLFEPVESQTAPASRAVDRDMGTALVEDMPPRRMPDQAPEPGGVDMPTVSDDGAEMPADMLSPQTPPSPPAAPEDRGLRLLVIGNSFQLDGPVPSLVGDLARDAGWPQPTIRLEAVRGNALSAHRERAETLAAVDEGSWDVVVLQEFSTKPTVARGDPEGYHGDALWFYDRIKAASPQAWVALQVTWPRGARHEFYPETFADPRAMLGELQTAIGAAAREVIPARSQAVRKRDVGVIDVGAVWLAHLERPDAAALHTSDHHHANALGQYLTAATIYAAIYQRRVAGRIRLGRDASAVTALQSVVDGELGFEQGGGPSDPVARPLASGKRLRIDCGGDDGGQPSATGWNRLMYEGPSLINAVDTEGATTTIDAEITDDFEGVNVLGLADNELGWPGQVSSDTLWTGSHTDHASGLSKPAQVTLSGLEPSARYTVRLFASRGNDDGGRGRLIRYTLGGAERDLEASDNRADVAAFEDISPSMEGTLVIDVAVSPAAQGRYAYLGAIEIERLR